MKKLLVTIGLIGATSIAMVGMFAGHKTVKNENNKNLSVACGMIENSGTQQDLVNGLFTGQTVIPTSNSQWQNRIFKI